MHSSRRRREAVQPSEFAGTIAALQLCTIFWSAAPCIAAAVAAAAATRSTLLRHGLLAFRYALWGRLCSGSKAHFVTTLLGGLEYAFR
eukprot:13140342-Alexandrium_andersonii.AAC.1